MTAPDLFTDPDAQPLDETSGMCKLDHHQLCEQRARRGLAIAGTPCACDCHRTTDPGGTNGPAR